MFLWPLLSIYHVNEGDFSLFPFFNLYADVFCSDLTSCLSLRYVFRKVFGW